MLNNTLLLLLLITTFTFIFTYTSMKIVRKRRKPNKPSLMSILIIGVLVSTVTTLTLIASVPQTSETSRFLAVNFNDEGAVKLEGSKATLSMYQESTQMLGQMEVPKSIYTFEETDEPSYVVYDKVYYENPIADFLLGGMKYDEVILHFNKQTNMTATLSNGILYPPGFDEAKKVENNKVIKSIEKIEESLKAEEDTNADSENEKGKDGEGAEPISTVNFD